MFQFWLQNVCIPWSTDRPEKKIRNSSRSPTPPKKKLKLSTNGVCLAGGNSRSSNGETESLLGQALEGGPSITIKAVSNSIKCQETSFYTGDYNLLGT